MASASGAPCTGATSLEAALSLQDPMRLFALQADLGRKTSGNDHDLLARVVALSKLSVTQSRKDQALKAAGAALGIYAGPGGAAAAAAAASAAVAAAAAASSGSGPSNSVSSSADLTLQQSLSVLPVHLAQVQEAIAAWNQDAGIYQRSIQILQVRDV